MGANYFDLVSKMLDAVTWQNKRKLSDISVK